MANFRSDRRSGYSSRGDSDRPNSRFGGRFGSRGGFRSRDSERSDRPTEMHDATCSKCGKNCQVPFKPTGSKPVLCRDCFRQSPSRDSGRSSRGNFNSRNQDRPFQSQQENSLEQFDKINAKLDKIIKILQELEMATEEDSDEDSKE